MGYRLAQIDAFTDRKFQGNPAAVCLLDAPKESSWMQSVAAEMNLSETAFLQKVDDGFSIRWFTPVIEVDLCGHATVASAHFLYSAGLVPKRSVISFCSNSGELTARSVDGWIELDFPATPAVFSDVPADLASAIGAELTYVGKTRFDYLIQVASEDILRALQPDFNRLRSIDSRGFLVTAKADGPYDFVSRCFFPAAGIDEDPVTGSAHCALTPYWAKRLGKSRLTAYQASPRGGVLRLENRGVRVMLAGQAVTTFTGELID